MRLPFGGWWVLRNDNLGEPLRKGSFETAELAFVDRFLRPGMTVLDLGAHHGLYTLLASKRVGRKGRVISFEPSPRERKALRLNLLINLRRNVEVRNMALGGQAGEENLFVVQGNQTGCNSLRPPIVSSGTSPVRVRVVRLDDWLAERKIEGIDFIKIDVEGAELETLKGSVQLLERRPRPIILVEVQDIRTRPWGYRAKEIIEFLQERGFNWFRAMPDGAVADAEMEVTSPDGNFIAIPEELGDLLSKLRSKWEQPFDTLRERWVSVPSGDGVFEKTTKLSALGDADLLAYWEKARRDITTGTEFAHRGWYHKLYADFMRGKKVLDVGSGFGVDSITFAQHGARVTFVDLVETNLRVLERLCKIMGLTAVQFLLLDNLDSLKTLDADYDVIMAMGSLHHAPSDVNKPEYQELLRHLKVGGRWLQLAYPYTRWFREGKHPFNKWGEVTDGEGTPWAEPYDLAKLLSMFGPARFDVVLYHEFHNSDFNWFDLLYRGTAQ
jgi:FkbM family methyltransferase